MRHDPELDEVLQDQELRRLAEMLSAAVRPDPPLDEAFRSGLRRQLMQQAWGTGDGRPSWWKRAFAPPGLAWIAATAGLLLIASVVVFMVTQQPGVNTLVVSSSMDGSHAVALQQPILVSFNQAMDHASTEAAVQIAPATNVTFTWSPSSNTLSVLPTSNGLAPNTQYQVTIGSTAKTATGQPLATAQTITFVTQPAATPAPSPSPTPRAPASPTSLLTAEHQLASLGGLASSAVQWSADSSTVYFVDAKGALNAVPAKGGDVKVVAPDGVTSPSIAPAGDRLAYIRAGNIQVLTFATGTTVETTVTPAATLVGWAKDRLVWATADFVYVAGPIKPSQSALPSGGAVTVLSFSPDGTHAVYRQDQKLFLLDVAGVKTPQLGQAGASFGGWSPDGTQLMYAGTDSLVIADLQGNTVGTLAGAEASWSAQDAILLGSDTDLYQVRPDGTFLTKLANGTYHMPAWAPNGAAFAFFRGAALWTATAPALPPPPNPLDEAAAAVNGFMQARQNNKADQAMNFLDDGGKLAYSSGELSLVINGDPRFTRFYVLTQVMTGSQPDTATFVVRLVLTHGKLDVSDFEETITLVRDTTTRHFLVDQAISGAHRALGKGAEVVGVVIAADSIKVTFDSDLDPATVTDGVLVLDSKGNPVEIITAYSNRTVTITGLQLKPGAQYRLVVLTSVRDVGGHNVASEYDLRLLAPAQRSKSNLKPAGGASSLAPASPAPTPS